MKTVCLQVNRSSSGRVISEGGVGVKKCHFEPTLQSHRVKRLRGTRLQIMPEGHLTVLSTDKNQHLASCLAKKVVGDRPKRFRRKVGT